MKAVEPQELFLPPLTQEERLEANDTMIRLRTLARVIDEAWDNPNSTVLKSEQYAVMMENLQLEAEALKRWLKVFADRAIAENERKARRNPKSDH